VIGLPGRAITRSRFFIRLEKKQQQFSFSICRRLANYGVF